ncbi:MAG: zinc-dependent metalloprotease [Candidatus Kapabacteria bacterium]|nr:zinc-dependent metalloprotease [Candidatus Kapabacteria bacterium]
MKRVLNITFILILVSINYIFAQVKTKPNDPKNPTCDECYCLPHSFPQNHCFDGKTFFSPDDSVNYEISRCVTIPLSNQLISKNINFWKYNHNLCFNYSDLGFPLQPGIRLTVEGFGDIEEMNNFSGSRDTIINGNATVRTYPIFKLSSIYDTNNSNSLIDRVFKEWKSNCPISDSTVRGDDFCCIKIYWSTDVRDFVLEPGERIENVLAKAFPDYNDHDDCDSIQVLCGREIIINATRQFFAPVDVPDVQYKIPSKFFFTDSIPTGTDAIFDINYDSKFKFYSLEDVLLHEVGHILGFKHSFDTICNTKVEGESVESIMFFDQPHSYKQGLTWQDRCAYKRANCCPIPDTSANQMFMNGSACDLASTIEHINKLQALSYPIPADQWVFVPTTVEGNYSVEIYDYVGRQYFNGSLESFDSKIGIPVGHLANGNYVIRVTISKNIQDFSIVISR